ncbi:MAG: hypothetical protein WA830_17245 [Candidatus Sulfotelmatobacter sp.]
MAGVSACDSMMRAATLLAQADASDGWGCADCEVVTARQQSWLQQPVLRMVVWSDSVVAEP